MNGVWSYFGLYKVFSYLKETITFAKYLGIDYVTKFYDDDAGIKMKQS